MQRRPGQVSGRGFGRAPTQVTGAAPRTDITRAELRAIRAKAANRNGPWRFDGLAWASRGLIGAGALGGLTAFAIRLPGAEALLSAALGHGAALGQGAALGHGTDAPLLAFAAGPGLIVASVLCASLGASLRVMRKP